MRKCSERNYFGMHIHVVPVLWYSWRFVCVIPIICFSIQPVWGISYDVCTLFLFLASACEVKCTCPCIYVRLYFM